MLGEIDTYAKPGGRFKAHVLLLELAAAFSTLDTSQRIMIARGKHRRYPYFVDNSFTKTLAGYYTTLHWHKGRSLSRGHLVAFQGGSKNFLASRDTPPKYFGKDAPGSLFQYVAIFGLRIWREEVDYLSTLDDIRTEDVEQLRNLPSIVGAFEKKFFRVAAYKVCY